MQAYVSTLEAEIKESRSKVETLNNEIHSGEANTIQQEHKKNQQEIEIFDLKEQLQSQKNEIKQQQADLAVSQKEAHEWHQKASNLERQVERLKSLVESLDQNKEELIKRLQAQAQNTKTEVSDKAILQNDIANYKRDLLTKDQEVIDLKHSIAALDANID